MSVFIKSLLRQPIIHFLLLGGGLFLLYGWMASGDSEADGNRIVVDREAILTFVQYRNRAFNDKAAAVYLEQLSAADYSRLVDDLVREEVLYREARKMGLDSDDYAIKRRLIQKMEYLARGFSSESDRVDEVAIAEFYRAHRDQYRQPATITFTHVFIDQAKPDAGQRASDLLGKLRRDKIEFAGGLGVGDRFLYHSNYVERDTDFVASHFGEEFARQLMKFDSEGEWLGPVQSDHGLHLVMIAGRDAGGVPPLKAIRETVIRDLMEEEMNAISEQFIRQLVESYEVMSPVDKPKLSPAAVDAS